MKKILFVDDEPMVLQGLRRMLRQFREEWDMHFVDNGPKALELMQHDHFDVVVTDMRMPEMDGTQLLTEVMRLYPDVVRIILSGYSGKELILRSVGQTHQYLAKPCDAETLKDTISRACALRELLANERIKKLVTRIETLPSLPSLYTEILEEISRPTASIQKAGEIIARDVGMTAKTLQLINSAFFGLPRQVASTAEAVSLLGLDTIKALVLSAHVFRQFEGSDANRTYVDFLFRHSTTVGTYARIICAEEGAEVKMRDAALMAGMLHEVGSLVLAANMPGDYENILKSAKDSGIAVSEAEMNAFGATHNEIGAFLLGLWGLPDPIVEAVGFCHRPAACPGAGFCPLTAVHAAEVLGHAQHPLRPGPAPEIDMTYLESLNLADRVPVWRQRCENISRKEEQ